MAIDLHMHSTESDGELTPEELVRIGKELGLIAMAVSDHDSYEGARRARIAGERIGMKVIMAAEISTSFEGKTLHVLTYGVDIDNPELRVTIDDLKKYRFDRAKSILGDINRELASGGEKTVDTEPIMALNREKPITRGDIAEELVRQGFVADKNEAFARWLVKYDRPNRSITVGDVARLAHGAGGVAVLAHPNSPYLSLNTLSPDFVEHERILTKFKTDGLDGIEVYHPDHSPEASEKYLDLARRLGLIATAGSDFHSATQGIGPTALGQYTGPDWIVAELETAIEKYRKSRTTA
ncbi:MAG: PHP domain-containing protein [Candidatus Vogelbacteria bacterium]|nr:PHP domain-containing protein [Candidatus Vogelbacteria bacterium]